MTHSLVLCTNRTPPGDWTEARPFTAESDRMTSLGSSFGACAFCKEKHYILNCTKFRIKSLEFRKNFIRVNKLCFACLGRNHQAREVQKQEIVRHMSGEPPHHNAYRTRRLPTEQRQLRPQLLPAPLITRIAAIQQRAPWLCRFTLTTSNTQKNRGLSSQC